MQLNRNFRRVWFSILTAILFSSIAGFVHAQRPTRPRTTPELRRGVNFGNMLEAPNEGEWGLTVQSLFFDKVAEAGFDHIRMPISWTHHALTAPPYTIDPVFMSRVRWVVDEAERRGLKIIINNHHYEELNANPASEWSRALAIWSQISTAFRNRSPRVFFEILNEPHGQFNENPQLWNQFMKEALAIIRRTNPTRPVLVGPVYWNSVGALAHFYPPKDDFLVATVHFYEPFAFTHQGAEWVNPSPPVGQTWNGLQYQLGSSWQNWSWGTSLDSTDDGLQVTFNQGWAGFQVHTDQPVPAMLLVLRVNKAMNLRVRFSNLQTEVFYPLLTVDGDHEYVIPVDVSVQPVTQIFVQNMTPSPVPAFLVQKMQLIGDDTYHIVATQADAIRVALKGASDWAQERGMPVYLGEFGAYNRADMTSRELWTTTVRQEAENLGMAFGYWEFGAGFGIYDPINNTWRLPLLRALLPNFQ